MNGLKIRWWWIIIAGAVITLTIVVVLAVTRHLNSGTVGALGSWVGGIGAVLAIVWAVDHVSTDLKEKLSNNLRQAALVSASCRANFARTSTPSWQGKGNDGPQPNCADTVTVHISNGSSETVQVEGIDLTFNGDSMDGQMTLPIAIPANSSLPVSVKVKRLFWERSSVSETDFPLEVNDQFGFTLKYRIADVLWTRRNSEMPTRLDK